MPTTFSSNENNDFFRGPDGDLSMSTGLDAVVQQCRELMETVVGEVIYTQGVGIDYDKTVWSGNPDLVKFERQARTQLLSVGTVQGVPSFTVEIVGDILLYTAIIDSTLGTGTVSNVV